MSVRRWLAAVLSVAGAVAVTVAVVTGSAPWPFGSSRPHAGTGPQARPYLDATACLLTGPSGIAPGTPGAPVWRAMQAASLATHVMVSYLPDTGPADAAVLLSTLVERRCGVIITSGTSAATVIKVASAGRQQAFVLVVAPGPAVLAGPPNTVIVSPAGAPARVGRAIRVLAAQARASGS
jgi:hypothetical protein